MLVRFRTLLGLLFLALPMIVGCGSHDDDADPASEYELRTGTFWFMGEPTTLTYR
jgi:hypothetical protein